MAGGWGGKRAGSGPKPKNPTKVAAARVVEEEVKSIYADKFGEDEWNAMTPLAVMLMSMRLALRENNFDKAFERAAHCANYMHPKLASQTTDINVGGGVIALPPKVQAQLDRLMDMSDEEIITLEADAVIMAPVESDHGPKH